MPFSCGFIVSAYVFQFHPGFISWKFVLEKVLCVYEYDRLDDNCYLLLRYQAVIENQLAWNANRNNDKKPTATTTPTTRNELLISVTLNRTNHPISWHLINLKCNNSISGSCASEWRERYSPPHAMLLNENYHHW